MTAEDNTGGNRQSITALIAWLSTCLLAGGLGTNIDPSTHLLWLRAGSFGLVAAVGLDVTSRLQLRRKRMKQWRILQRRCDYSLGIFVAERDIAEEIRTAVTRLLTAHPATAGDGQAGSRESRWACNLQVEVYDVRKGTAETRPETDKVGVLGRLDNLSNSGFGLILEERLASRLVIIAILSPEEQEFDLLGEILWCDPSPDGRMRAGGRLLRVLPMGSRDSVDAPSVETEDEPAEAAC